MVTFEVLGPVRLVRADGSAQVPRGLQGKLLAALLVHANQAVPADRLIEAMWGADREAGTVHRLQTHIYRLRKILGAGADISSMAGGYVLATDPASVDSGQFESLVQGAKRISGEDPQAAAESLRKALSLWRGEAFEGLDMPEVRSHALRLHDLKLMALEQLYSAELECGQYDLVANELPSTVEAHPLRERLHELLVMSHALGGRQADALAAYRRARSVLVEELGVEPGARLRELEIKILKGESVEPQTPAPKPTPAPAQLPAGPGSFVGREEELGQLDALLPATGGAASVAAVTGGAGMGKTALVLHWAHHHREEFPDGQLYMDLRGYGPDTPVEPEVVLLRLLRGLGVPPQLIPDELEERAALFRSETAERRMLMVLDNARDAGQVRPLLPGTASCAVIVTSREALTGIVVQEGAHQIGLQRMTEDEATALVTQLLGAPQLGEDAVRLTELCAHLPLALRIAVERVRALGADALGTLVAELDDASSTLDLLDGGDERSSVRGVFLWSYQELDEAAAWLFRCFGTTPLRVISASALAAAAGLDTRVARRGLEPLRRAHLVELSGHSRFRLHDLLRSFAAELSEETDTDPQRREVFERLCHYYLTTTAAALEQIMPEELTFPTARTVLDDESLERPFADSDSAARWLDAERENLVLLIEHALPAGLFSFIAKAWPLLRRYFDTKSLHDEAQRVYTAALTAGRRSGNRRDEGGALGMLGWVAIRRGRFEQAFEHLHAAVTIHEDLDDRRQRAHNHNMLGGAYMVAKRIPEAITHYEKAIADYATLEDHSGSFTMANFGLLHHRLGNLCEALKWLETTLESSEERGSPYSECHALRTLVAVHGDLGDYDQALDCAARGLSLAEELGHDTVRAGVLNRLGTVHRRRKEPDEARACYLEALSTGEALGGEEIIADSHHGLAEIAVAEADLDGALHHHRTALDLAHRSWDLRSRILIDLGETYLQRGDTATAVEHWREALAIYQQVGHSQVPALQGKISSNS